MTTATLPRPTMPARQDKTVVIKLPRWLYRLIVVGGIFTVGVLFGSAEPAEAHEVPRKAPAVVQGVAEGPQRTAVFYRVNAYEDGSGTITRTVTRGGTVALVSTAKIGEALLPWDCRTMGNRVCGPQAAANGVDGPSTVTLVMAQRAGMPHSVALTISTQRDGSVRVVGARVATDEDAEGEVV